jgi:hypothetical protein
MAAGPRYTGVPGEGADIQEGHSIRNSKNVHMHMCPVPNGFRDRILSLCTSKVVDKKEVLYTVSKSGIYKSDKVGTVHLV